MKQDIVERLRDDYQKTVELCAEAADEIERLRVEVDLAHKRGWKAAKLAMLGERGGQTR